MEAVILAGGRGTRLQSVVSDVPKPMAPMDAEGTPFLAFLLEQLRRQGTEHIVLATGYMSEVIEAAFGASYHGIQLTYSVETSPLGTGGAMKQALSFCTETDVIVLNGDTLFDVDFTRLLQLHKENGADLTMAVRYLEDTARYGTVALKDHRIVGFHEKGYAQSGYINGGIYAVKRDLLESVSATRFSFEKAFLECCTNTVRMYAASEEGYFIDIGIPEDYERAKTDWIASRA